MCFSNEKGSKITNVLGEVSLVFVCINNNEQWTRHLPPPAVPFAPTICKRPIYRDVVVQNLDPATTMASGDDPPSSPDNPKPQKERTSEEQTSTSSEGHDQRYVLTLLQTDSEMKKNVTNIIQSCVYFLSIIN